MVDEPAGFVTGETIDGGLTRSGTPKAELLADGTPDGTSVVIRQVRLPPERQSLADHSLEGLRVRVWRSKFERVGHVGMLAPKAKNA
jgi:hypothetical protein